MSETAQHTPGPWSWDAGMIPPDGPGQYADIYVLDEDREPIILAEFNDNLPDGRANARLIAAAPELLSIARRFVALPSGSWHPERHAFEEAELITEAKAVIAKATGAA